MPDLNVTFGGQTLGLELYDPATAAVLARIEAAAVGAETNATDAENGDRRARFYSRAARDRAIACDDTATNQRCKIEWHFIGDFDQRVFVNDHLLCKR